MDTNTQEPQWKLNAEENKRRIIELKTNLPTHSELRERRRQVTADDRPYWKGILQDATQNAEDLLKRIRIAESILKDLVALKRPLTSSERSKKYGAETQIDRATWRRENELKRIGRAEANLAACERKLKEIDHALAKGDYRDDD